MYNYFSICRIFIYKKLYIKLFIDLIDNDFFDNCVYMYNGFVILWYVIIDFLLIVIY